MAAPAVDWTAKVTRRVQRHTAYLESLATPHRMVLKRGDFPHLCPGNNCAMCRWVNLRAFRKASGE